MFESMSETALLSVMRDALRRERIATAERVLAAGRFALDRFEADDEEDRFQWCLDVFELVAAEVSAELGVSRGRASSEMWRGMALIERLPKVAAAFAAGEVDYRVVIAIVFRTDLVQDPQIAAALDEQLALLAPAWNGRSREKLDELINWQIRQIDPAAERVARDNTKDRFLDVYARDDGLTDISGRVHAVDGAALEAKLNQLADSVCANDPRTKDQRRADAVGALASGATQLACGCGGADCTQEGSTTGAGVQVVITVIAEAQTLAGKSETPALVPGYGAIPAPAARELAATAKLRNLLAPQDFTIEPQYRPSTAMAAFIRCRDLHCRFPACTRPAQIADIDHTVPYPLGPTHPSNCKLLCRIHHLLKTFEPGWRDVQLPDGIVIWTSPKGRTFTTKPGGVLFFPQLGSPTGALIIPANTEAPKPGRMLTMPTRRRTRQEERTSRITWERGHNEARLALLGEPIPEPAQAISDYTEAPF
jgi:hypothetical protein